MREASADDDTEGFNPLFSGLTLKVGMLGIEEVLRLFQSPIFGADAQSVSSKN